MIHILNTFKYNSDKSTINLIELVLRSGFEPKSLAFVSLIKLIFFNIALVTSKKINKIRAQNVNFAGKSIT
ncbi:hypothetical protein AWE51_08825 [Aquimarina aggregata]|uniref:Uncharacterized protein n=1 Tax=Aquimarina aggregata TaxID=1642818 RepID=A0A162ZE41_9FLAO|nr:hypothetical protein AWE51_08825 [Aquimarina aggregata]